MLQPRTRSAAVAGIGFIPTVPLRHLTDVSIHPKPIFIVAMKGNGFIGVRQLAEGARGGAPGSCFGGVVVVLGSVV
jgi:hypothetical protein